MTEGGDKSKIRPEKFIFTLALVLDFLYIFFSTKTFLQALYLSDFKGNIFAKRNLIHANFGACIFPLKIERAHGSI